MVAHGCAHSSRKIIKTLVADCECRLMGGRVKGGKNGEAHFRVSHILLTQNRNAGGNVRRSDANRARSVLRGLGGIFV